MANTIRESFLRWLHHEREHVRLDNYTVYDGYYNGEHDIDIPAKVKAALESELGTVCNYCRVVVDTAVDYILGGEVGIECKESPEAEAFLYDVYEANHLLGEEMMKAVTVMGKKGDVFLKLYIEDEEIKVKILRPDIVFPRYRTDDYTDMLYCAVKWYEENEEDPTKQNWKAQVFREDVIEEWELGESEETEYSQWEFKSSEKNVLGFIPIIHIKNTVDDLEFGVSDLQVMTDLQDALNKTMTDMLLTMDNQAFQRLFLWGAQTPKGYEVSMEPGMITEVPNAEGHLDIVQPSQIAPFLAALKEIVFQIVTITSISKMPIVEPEVSHPASGFALQVRAIPLERKCGKKITVLKNRFAELDQMIFKAAQVLKQGDYVGTRTRLHFTPGLPVDEMTQMQVHDMELRARVKSRRTVMQERGIEDVEAESEQMRKEEREDMEFALKMQQAQALQAQMAAVVPSVSPGVEEVPAGTEEA